MPAPRRAGAVVDQRLSSRRRRSGVPGRRRCRAGGTPALLAGSGCWEPGSRAVRRAMQSSVPSIGMRLRRWRVGVLSSLFRLTGHGRLASVACESERSANMHISRCNLPPRPARSPTIVLWAVSVVGLMWLAPSAVDAQRRGLFSAVHDDAAQPQSPASLDTTTARRRVVTIGLGRLRQARASTAEPPRPAVRSKPLSQLPRRRAASPVSDTTPPLHLFGDIVFTGIAERTPPTFSGGYSLSGRLIGERLGTLTLAVNGETVAGTVRTLGGKYRIRSARDGPFAISEVEEPPLDCEVEEPQGRLQQGAQAAGRQR